MDEYKIFNVMTGYELRPYDWDMLRLYAEVDDDKDTIEQIEIMSSGYPDPQQAEVGFVFLLAWLKTQG